MVLYYFIVFQFINKLKSLNKADKNSIGEPSPENLPLRQCGKTKLLKGFETDGFKFNKTSPVKRIVLLELIKKNRV